MLECLLECCISLMICAEGRDAVSERVMEVILWRGDIALECVWSEGTAELDRD